MGIFEYKTHIRYTDINENNELSDKGILNILSEAAGVHSEVVRILCKQYRRNRIFMDVTILENTNLQKTMLGHRGKSQNLGKEIRENIILERFFSIW